MTNTIRIETVDDPGPEVREPIERGLYEYNRDQLGATMVHRYQKVAFVARDEAGKVVGGLLGDLIWDFLHIDILWVTPDYRDKDLGSFLLNNAETTAKKRGYFHASLETTSFQALTFYQKNGYWIAGQVPNKPRGHTWYYLEKDLA
jgi:GNAT superfamily N-acetyltransferase